MAKEKKTLIEAAISELHRVYRHLNNELFGGKLPLPAIVIESKGKRNAYGWCSVERIWTDADGATATYELGIASEYLNRPYIDVMTTLLHEMLHIFCRVTGEFVKDEETGEMKFEETYKETSRGYTYHNKVFKKVAEMHGMEYTHGKPDSKIGYSAVTLKPETRAIIENLELDAEAFKVARMDFGVGEKKKKSPKSWKYECPNVECKTVVRATKETKLICGECFEENGELALLVCNEPPGQEGENDGEEGAA